MGTPQMPLKRGRRQRESGDELGEDQRTAAVLREQTLGFVQDAGAAMPLQETVDGGASPRAGQVPQIIGQGASDQSRGKGGNQIQLAGGGERSGGEQCRRGRDRQADLLCENPEE